MSLWADYQKEREGFHCVELEHGFATYKFNGDYCYIRDIYVSPEHRQSHLASEMADKIAELAKDRGCKYLLGTVCPQANGATQSLKVLLAYGFDLAEANEVLITFKKEIQ